jgi:RNA polymerase sigma-70 factor (ECF subfamily)
MSQISTSDALDRVLRKFDGMLAQAGLERGLSRSELDELRQDVRIRLWQALETGEKIENVAATYVRRAAVTAALDFLRRRQIHTAEVLGESRNTGEQPVPRAARVSAPDSQFARDQLVEVIARVVNGLNASRRVVVQLYLVGYSRAEIATQMGWTEARTRNLLYRGLGDVRARLEALGVQP